MCRRTEDSVIGVQCVPGDMMTCRMCVLLSHDRALSATFILPTNGVSSLVTLHLAGENLKIVLAALDLLRPCCAELVDVPMSLPDSILPTFPADPASLKTLEGDYRTTRAMWG